MELVAFGVKNYRSITQASKLPLQPTATVLIGPNNEGKSNLVSALAVAITGIRAFGIRHISTTDHRFFWRTREGVRYRWSQDFPMGRQASNPKGESQFDLEFRLSQAEVDEFWAEVKSSLNGTLPIRLLLGERSFKFLVPKKGPGAAALTRKANAIARFVGKRIDFRHIRAIRTAHEANSVVKNLIQSELSILDEDPTYRAAVKQIASLQTPILKALSLSVRDTLRAFLPTVRSVDISIPQQTRYDALSTACEIVVDDGVPTRLDQKGDGVQSLAAMALMRSASQKSAGTRKLILAIEEPESHLHPKAIHQLRQVIADLAKQHQTILTTHCPLFVERNQSASNIIVVDSQAHQATSTQQIRDVLGVRVADNLIHAELILVVEGDTDRVSLTPLLEAYSTKLRQALRDNYLVVDPLVGAGRLSHRLLTARDAMCRVYCFLDNDLAGREAVKLAQRDALLAPADYTLAMRPGLKDSEIEDLFDVGLYTPWVHSQYGVDLGAQRSASTKLKWSDRLSAAFKASGKIWDDAVKLTIKGYIATQVAHSPSTAVLPFARPALDGLVTALEQRVH